MRLRGYDYSKEGLYFVTIDCNNMECHFGAVFKGRVILSDFGKVAVDEWLKLSSRFKNFQLDTFQIMPHHMHAIVVLINPEEVPSDIGETSLPLSDVAVQAPLCNEEAQVPLCDEEVQAPLCDEEAGASPANTISEMDFCKMNVVPGQAPVSVKNKSKSLSDIIGSYKSIVANACLEIHKQKYAGMARTPLLGKIWKRGFFDHIIRDTPSYKSVSRYIRNNPKKWTYR